jgi:hypothetical protein
MLLVDGLCAAVLLVALPRAATTFCEPLLFGLRFAPGRVACTRPSKPREPAAAGRRPDAGGLPFPGSSPRTPFVLVDGLPFLVLVVVIGLLGLGSDGYLLGSGYCWAVCLTVSALSCALDFSSSACC